MRPILIVPALSVPRRALFGALLGALLGGLPVLAGDRPVVEGGYNYVPFNHRPVIPSPDLTVIPPLTGVLGGSVAGAALLTSAAEASAAETQKISNALGRSTSFCNALTVDAYKIDCLAYEYWQISEQLPRTGDYAEVQKTLADTAAKLKALAKANQSSTLPAGRARSTGAEARRTTRALVPVAPERLPQLKEQAAAIVEEAQTVLLRSAGNSERRRAQFQRISAAMETGTILLRAI
ncbi:hypothetical protein [Maritimibacter alkaliphilus]|uniref:hypothetical protein n=1 Tax=Maritimibacter alkaliphilus TaxID=404236 RepID=UPI001C984925|nr:hypothetical protein [Maritimibacter alkaliphilus]MBY6089206.1 hypothetical protein [Maritimibacter alkaliphilus]